MKILNLYSGIGGNRKLWGNNHDITAVEYDKDIAAVYKENFPNDKIIIADAHFFLEQHYDEYDFIWASPPCPTHSRIRQTGVYMGQNRAVYPDMRLYQEIILLQYFAPQKTRWVIENVNAYYQPLIPPTKKLHRHFYWSNFPINDFVVTNNRKHEDIKATSTVYGFNISHTKLDNKIKVLRNMVDPELGSHILDCAMNVIRKQNEKQLEIF